MGASNSKPISCPFEKLRKAKRTTAKSMRYTKGVASPFYFLCVEGKVDEVRRILEAEDSPSIDELNELQPNGSTALHAATFYNHPDVVRLLLEHNCPRTALNRFGNTAYEEAETDEMKQLFYRYNSSARFHETNTADTIAVYLPEENSEDVDAGNEPDYVHVFKSQADILEYIINQHTTAMWVKFYNWFFHTFRTFLENEYLHIESFDLHNHPDFQEFLKRSLPDRTVEETMQSVNESHRRNSVEPLITLYTREDAGFYKSLNKLLGQSASDPKISSNLCDRFIIEFYIHRHELKQRAFTGMTYRGATIPISDLDIYKRAMESKPPGVLGLKAFTSTSRDPLRALDFAFRETPNERQKHVLFVFEILEASSSIFGIDDVSAYGHEEEVLILPGNLFTVTNMEEQVNTLVTKVYLRHWKTSVSFWKRIRQTIHAGTTSVL